MNLRERLADIISGGAITRAREAEEKWFGRYAHAINAVNAIDAATAHTKNGTGKMVHRMAREALTSIRTP